MNKNFEFWKKLAFILLGLSIPLSAINGMAGAAPFGLGVALCVHLLLALSRAEKLLKKSKTCLRVTKRKLLQDRPVVGVPVDELIFLTWAGENSLDLCLLETLPLAGFEYSASVKHCLYLFPGKGKLVQNKLCCHTAGRMSLGQIRVIISDDWGVFELVRSLEAPFQPIFYPPVYMKMQLSPQTAMGLSPAMGIHRLSRAGEGAELHEIRDYHPGDSYRKMLWSATARTGRLIVR
ncbi:MAG: DUF58 domain-containing protein, partial [Victivallales bacterium]|nr:DUF58 domain-containing protein [Victivallales bacterium]